MKVSGIIPARYKSSRFPGKPLVKIAGKPLVLHVAEKAAAALGKENIFIATEDERIEKEVMNAGYNAVMTSDNCLTGTDRLWEAAQKIKADIYINIQGDEPMVDPQDIINVMKAKQQFQDAVINGMCLLNENENAENINIPKVVVNSRNDLIYMSRLAVPGIKSGNLKPRYLKQVCIYAFNFDELKQFGSMKNKAEFEMFEDIEILRFLELGIPVKMVFTSGNTLAVDVPDDVSKVEAALKSAHV
jgi:3-deoxy-manno-octulosonate cytidylyltransferase (CMP-KDO synthetase)